MLDDVLRADLAGHERAHAVRADDQAGPFRRLGAAGRGVPHADDPAVLEQQVVDRAALLELDAGLDGALREDRVEHEAPRRVRGRQAVHRQGEALDADTGPLVDLLGDRPAARVAELVEQSPPVEQRHALHVQVVRGQRVLRESRFLQEQHSITLLRK